MKCEICKTEIPDGQLLCPKCGWEIQIVPDFESVIETTVTDVLDNIAGHIQKTQLEEEEDFLTERKEKNSYNMHFYSTLIAAIVVVILLGGAWYVLSKRTPERSLESAQNAYKNGEYERCIELYRDHLEDNPDDGEILLSIADCYEHLERYDEALNIYNRIRKEPVFAEETFKDPDAGTIRDAALRATIDIYMNRKDYVAANDILMSPEAEHVRGDYPSLAAYPPEFSIPQDTYDEPLYLRLMDLGSGTIYFTTDGSDPTPASDIFDLPLLLDEGIYTIKAMTVNPYGIQSEIITQVYEIQSIGEVTITPQSGLISVPENVTVNAPSDCIVYYTSDGSFPSRDSKRYTGPVPIPDGDSIFRFLIVMEDTNIEEEAVRHYNFQYEGNISRADAVNLLTDGLVRAGVISFQTGVVVGVPGRNLYMCNGVISINSNYYYLVVEYHEDQDMMPQKTGNLFCVDTENGSLYRATMDGDGHYSVVSL